MGSGVFVSLSSRLVGPAVDAKCDGTPSGGFVVLVGVGKRPPHGFRCLY